KKAKIRKGYRNLLTRRVQGDELLKALKKVDEEIIELIDDGEVIVCEIDEADRFNETVYEVLARVEAKLKKLVEKESVAACKSSVRAKLPKLDLPVFNGEITKWFTFWDSYKAAVHDNSDLLPVQKFTYLRSLLSRSAQECIAGLTSTEANDTEAVIVLGSRFGNKERIIAKHMEALLHLYPVSWQGNTLALCTLYHKIENHLPSELSLAISRKISEDDWKFDKIMEELSQELQARERTLPKPDSSRRTSHFRESKPQRERPTSATLYTSITHCCYCDEENAPESCTKVDKIDIKKSMLRDSGRCFICLRRGHISRNCRSSIKYSLCSNKHHTSICMNKRESSKEGESAKRLNPKADPFKSATLLTDAKGTILLQTAQATVHNTKSTESATLRLVCDSGSYRSYITEEVCRKLSLRIVGKKDLVIATFGNTGGRRQSYKIAQAVLETNDGNTLVLNLMVVPLICEPLVGVSLRGCIIGYDHLKDLDLADPGTNGDVIELDILIGLDYYWDIVSGEVLRGDCAPTATYSSLGWLLSCPVASASTTLVTHVLTCGVRAGQEKLELTEQLQKFWEIESLVKWRVLKIYLLRRDLI
uniref:CCHC-type domain-containing protein n=1 Tax=Amphimedon queenslandica TaxID=400682 RepID=A0A1X7U524_AMPQE